MFNKEFLKKLTILYVEDEDLAREQLARTLKRVFGNVLVAPNGLEGYETYAKTLKEGKVIDLILSDINMPKMNGIEMLEKIRETDHETPFIFTTARSETEYLLRAIELNVNHYALKPIDTDDILMRIQKVCEKKYFQKKLNSKEEELQNYISAINNVALVFKMNAEGNINFANESFIEISQYTKEEILTMNFSHILHPDIPANFIEKLWESLKQGETFKDNLKFVTKDKELFYLNNSSFKIDNDETEEFISIGFLTTKEQMEKREFHKKVMLNIKESKQKEHTAQKIINDQNYKLEQLKEYVLEADKKLEAEKKKNITVQKQLHYYESKVHDIDDEKNDFFKNANERLKEFTKSYEAMKKEKEQFLSQKSKLEEQVEASRIEMEKLYASIEERDKRLLKTQDLLQYRESQIMLVDPKLLNR